MHEIVALLMAGGRGSRMAASGAEVPKPLVEVGGRPLIVLAIQRLLRVGIREIHIALHHRADDAESERQDDADRCDPTDAAVDELEDAVRALLAHGPPHREHPNTIRPQTARSRRLGSALQ